MNRLLSAAVAALLIGSTAGAASASPEAERFGALVDEAAAAELPVLGIAALVEMGSWQEWLPVRDVIDQLLELAERARRPEVRDVALYRALREAFATGDDPLVAQLEERLGFVDQWNLIGPFPNDGMSGFARRYAPETDGVFEGEVPGKVAPVAWRPLERVSETGYLAVSELVAPSHDAVAYAATEFDADATRPAVLSMAIDGAYRVWLNGVPVASLGDHLGGYFLRDRAPVTLVEGRNTLLVKMAADDGPMGFHLRILDPDGEPIRVRARPATSLPPAGEVEVWPRSQTVSDALSEALASDAEAAGSPDDLAAAAYVLRSLQSADPTQPWRRFAERAESIGVTGTAAFRLAQVHDEGWLRDELLDTARCSGEPLFELAWIRARREQMGQRPFEQAAAALRALLESDDPPLGARLERAWFERDIGFRLTALETVEELGRDAGWPAAVLDAYAALARAARRNDLLADAYERRVARHRNDPSGYDDLATALRVAGRAAEVETLVDELTRRLEMSPRAFVEAAWILRAGGDLERAIRVLDQAVELCPGEADHLALRGRFALESGDRDRAADDFAAALALRPQDSSLRDLLEVVDPDDEDRFAAYRLSLDDLRDLRSGAGPAADVAYTILADQSVTRVFENGLATTWVQQAFDVHSRSGADELRSFTVAYTPDAEVVEVASVRIAKPDGRVLEVYESADRAVGSGPSSIYYDVRTRQLYFTGLEPGDLLVVEYTVADVAYQNIFDDYFGDVWFVQGSAPKRFARYVVQAPLSRSIQHNEPAFGAWTEAVDGELRTLTFEARDVPQPPRESGAPGVAESRAYLSVSTYADWDVLADWYWHLIEDQLVPGPEIAATVRSLTEGLDDRRAIVAAIYGYVVRNTRYVGLEFGIHGYKPYRTTDCFNRRFGDCKDTASLMKVMLELAGVDARVALVRTRDLGTIGDFPPSLAVFNHAITYVPEFDLFLDGTAGFSGSTELPSGDQGASVLVVDDGQGGRFGTIPVHPASASVNAVRFDVDLRGEVPRATAEMRLTGAFAPAARVAFESPQRRTERLEAELVADVPGTRVLDATFAGVSDIEQPVAIDAHLEGGEWVRAQGAERTLKPTGEWDDLTARYAGTASRTLPVVLQFAHTYEAGFVFELPDSWTPLEVPPPVRLESPFGSLSTTSEFADGELRSTMVLTIDSHRVEPEEYPAFREFLQRVDAALDRVARFTEEAP